MFKSFLPDPENPCPGQDFSGLSIIRLRLDVRVLFLAELKLPKVQDSRQFQTNFDDL